MSEQSGILDAVEAVSPSPHVQQGPSSGGRHRTNPGGPRRWQLIASLLVCVWLAAQAVAGWKFFNGNTYPIVGAGMFAGPPSPDSADFLVPRVYCVAADGSRTELDQHTFELEPFEWRRWIKRNLEQVTAAQARTAAVELAAVVDDRGGPICDSIQLWRVPATTTMFEQGQRIRSVTL